MIRAASNGAAAVAVTASSAGPVCARYAPRALGDAARADEFRELFTRAAAKLGYLPDRRYRTGWRKARP